MSYFDKPPVDIAKLIQYIESEGIQCEYNPYGSFDYIEVSIKDVDEICVDMDAEIHIWSKDAYYVELDRSRYPISLSCIRNNKYCLRFQFEPSYYQD
jgi:hypothetical protein